jgi:hypothetical protein
MPIPNREVPAYISQNLLDRQFGEWNVIGFAGRQKGGIAWLCRCSCGRVKEVLTRNLTSGPSTQCKSCALAKIRRRGAGHGYAHTRTYRGWQLAKRSGHCIALWKEFRNFLKDMGECPKGHRLRRINAQSVVTEHEPFVEAWVRWIKAECLDHFIVLGENDLRHLMREWLEPTNLALPFAEKGTSAGPTWSCGLPL